MKDWYLSLVPSEYPQLSVCLYTEALELPLQINFQRWDLQYYIKIKSLPIDLVYDSLFNPKLKLVFTQKEKAIQPFGLHMKPKLKVEISLNRNSAI